MNGIWHRRTSLAALAAVAASAMGAAPASAAFECGDTITADKTLRRDLDCSKSFATSAIRIGADGVKLDLNGHTIRSPVPDPGVRTNEGIGDVRIVDGRIRGGAGGVLIVGGVNNVVKGLDVKGGFAIGIEVTAGGSGHRIVENTVTNSGDGIHILGGTVVAEIANNVVSGGEIGLLLTSAVAPTVTGNTLTDTGEDAIAVQDVTGGTVARNLVSGTGGAGISTNEDSLGVTLKRNQIVEPDVFGIQVLAGGNGINLIANTVLESLGDGVLVADVTSGSVRRNVVKRSDANGILVTDDNILIEDNVANANTELGILSDSSNGSGNIARHNGDPAECSPASLCEPEMR